MLSFVTNLNPMYAHLIAGDYKDIHWSHDSITFQVLINTIHDCYLYQACIAIILLDLDLGNHMMFWILYLQMRIIL